MIILKIVLLILLVLPFLFLCLRLFISAREIHKKDLSAIEEAQKNQKRENRSNEDIRKKGMNDYEKRNIRNHRRS